MNNNLRTIIWFQVFLCILNNLHNYIVSSIFNSYIFRVTNANTSNNNNDNSAMKIARLQINLATLKKFTRINSSIIMSTDTKWTQEEHRYEINTRKNVKLIKKIMTEKKTTLLSLRNQNWKEVKVKIEKINKLSSNIPTGNIAELLTVFELLSSSLLLYSQHFGWYVPRTSEDRRCLQ